MKRDSKQAGQKRRKVTCSDLTAHLNSSLQLLLILSSILMTRFTSILFSHVSFGKKILIKHSSYVLGNISPWVNSLLVVLVYIPTLIKTGRFFVRLQLLARNNGHILTRIEERPIPYSMYYARVHSRYFACLLIVVHLHTELHTELHASTSDLGIILHDTAVYSRADPQYDLIQLPFPPANSMWSLDKV